MPKCPTCGRQTEEGANFCPVCGAALLSPAVGEMIQDARQVLAKNPDDASARYNLAIAYKLAGMDDQAVEQFAWVAALQPDFADVHYELGLLHAKHGRRDDAVAALIRARDLDPDDDRAARLLARLGADA